jgi:hypothetical protein
MEEHRLPLSAFRPSGRHVLGRPKQRWKDQEHLHDHEQQALTDMNRKVYGDGDHVTAC